MTTPQIPYNPTRPAPHARGLNPWLIRIPVLFIVGMTLLVLLLAVYLAAFQLAYAERLYPGVFVGSTAVGGMTLDEARAALESDFTLDDATVFTFRYGEQVWQASAGDLGLGIDADASLAAAYAVGHDSGLLSNLLTQADAWFTGADVAPVVRYDQSVALRQLEMIAAQVNRPPVDATLTLDGATVASSPSQSGRTLDIAAALSQLDARMLALDLGGEIPLVVNETPPSIRDADAAADKIRLALSGPVQLVAADEQSGELGPWTATVDQIATLLNVQLVDHDDGTRSYDVGINMNAFESFLAGLAPGLIVTSQDGRFHFDETTGQLEVVQPSVSGRELNISETLARLEQGVFSGGAESRVVPMAFTLTLPRYHNQISAQELGITELVAESTSYFTGSTTNRRTNIAVSASKFDGVIIGPGEEFSFNRILGDISYENGFVDGKVIFGGNTVTGIGGGVCQISTTAFRAALNGGFVITERNSHGYRVGYYELNNTPPGLDAAIWTPERDLRFQNDTPYHLLIETSIYPNENAVQFRLYSTNPGRYVEFEEVVVRNVTPAPEMRFVASDELQPGEIRQVDYSAEGADVTVYVNVYDEATGELIRRDNYFTHYLPWQAVFEVAPTDSRLSES